MSRKSSKKYYIYPRKLKSGTYYYCQFRLADGSLSTGEPTGCTKEKDAENWAIEQIEEKAKEAVRKEIEQQKKEGKFLNNKAAFITFSDFAGSDFFSWESRWALNKRAAGKRISKEHCLTCDSMLRKHIIPEMGNKKLHEIDEKVLEDFRNILYKNEYSDSLNKKCLLLIRDVLREARKQGLLKHVPEIPETGNRQKIRGVLTPAEVKALFSIEWPNYMAYVANLLAASCGARLGEVQGLLIEDCDTQNGIIHIRHSWEKRTKVLKDGTKNGKPGRFVVIPSRVCRELEKVIMMNPDRGNPESFVFFGYYKFNQPAESKFFNNALYDALERIGVDRKAKGISFHSHRVFFNSLCVNSGIATAKTQAQLGHSTIQMTEGTYYRPDNMEDIRQLQENFFQFADITTGEKQTH